MSILESIKKGLEITNRSLKLMMALFVFGVIWNTATILTAPQNNENPDLPTTILLSALGIFFLLVSVFVQAGSMGYIRDAIKTGRAEFDSFLSSGKKYYTRFLLLGLFVMGIFMVGGLLIALLVAVLSRVQEIAGIIAGVVLGAVGIYVLFLMFFAPYVIVTDEGKVISSIQKSIAFVRKNILALLGLTLIVFLIGFGAGLASGAIVEASKALVPVSASLVIMAIVSSLINAYLGIWVSGTYMSFYLGKTS